MAARQLLEGGGGGRAAWRGGAESELWRAQGELKCVMNALQCPLQRHTALLPAWALLCCARPPSPVRRLPRPSFCLSAYGWLCLKLL